MTRPTRTGSKQALTPPLRAFQLRRMCRAQLLDARRRLLPQRAQLSLERSVRVSSSSLVGTLGLLVVLCLESRRLCGEALFECLYARDDSCESATPFACPVG